PALFCSDPQVAREVVKNNLSLILFPEGTRSRDGRLLPFKKVHTNSSLWLLQQNLNQKKKRKSTRAQNSFLFMWVQNLEVQGFVHAALQTRLPIVPIV